MAEPEELMGVKIEEFEQSIKEQNDRDKMLLRLGFSMGAQAALDSLKELENIYAIQS